MDCDSEKKDASVNLPKSLKLSGKALGVFVRAFVEKGAAIQFRARGNSMFPFIKDGDVVTVLPYGDKTPEPGDVAAFIDSDTEKLIVHRILSFHSNNFTAKGDNCLRTDAKQPQNNILGYISKINHRKHVYCDIDYRLSKKCITLFSKFGLTAIFGIISQKYNYCRNSLKHGAFDD